MIRKYQLICLIILNVHLVYVSGLKCYSCISSSVNTPCEKNAASSAVINCNKKYCVIRRMEYTETGEVASFYRGCESNPDYLNGVVVDAHYTTHFTSCTSDLCNSGDGKSSGSSSGSGSSGSGGSSGSSGGSSIDNDGNIDKTALEVPGIGFSSAKAIYINSILTLFCFYLLLNIN